MSVPRDDGFVHLADYTPPAWRIPHVELQFELAAETTEVSARLQLEPDPAQPGAPLVLDGVDLELLAIAIDGAPLPADRYAYDGRRLQVHGVAQACVLETRVRIHPAANTRLEGLYRSGRLLLLPC